MVKQIFNYRIEKEKQVQAKRMAKAEGISFSEYVRNRIFCEPEIIQKLNLILQKLGGKDGRNK